MGGFDQYWTPYGSDFFDTLALDGLYYLTINDLNQAQSKMNRIIEKAGSVMDPQTLLY